MNIVSFTKVFSKYYTKVFGRYLPNIYIYLGLFPHNQCSLGSCGQGKNQAIGELRRVKVLSPRPRPLLMALLGVGCRHPGHGWNQCHLPGLPPVYTYGLEQIKPMVAKRRKESYAQGGF